MEGEVREQAEDIAQTSKEVLESVKEAGSEAKEGLRATAHEIASALKREGRNFIDEQKQRVGTKFSSFSDLARDTAKRYRDENYPNVAVYAETFADKLDTAGRYVQDTPAGEIVQDIEDEVRERPEIFLGAMLLLGVVAARFFRASAPSPSPYGYYEH